MGLSTGEVCCEYQTMGSECPMVREALGNSPTATKACQNKHDFVTRLRPDLQSINPDISDLAELKTSPSKVLHSDSATLNHRCNEPAGRAQMLPKHQSKHNELLLGPGAQRFPEPRQNLIAATTRINHVNQPLRHADANESCQSMRSANPAAVGTVRNSDLTEVKKNGFYA